MCFGPRATCRCPLGVAKTAGGPRVYRRSDVEQVLRIRHLLLVEGLTLAGARRKLEEDAAPIVADAAAIDEVNKLIGANARERLTSVKRVLQSLLDLLGNPPTAPRAIEAKGKRLTLAPVRKKSAAKRRGGGRRGRA